MSSSINPQNNRDLNRGTLNIWSKFGGPSLNGWWVIGRTSSKWGKFLLRSLIWPWRLRSITPQNHRDLNWGVLHLWFKFGDPSLNGSQVIARTSKWLTHGRTDRRRQRQYPMAIQASGKNESKRKVQYITAQRLRAKGNKTRSLP